MFKKMNKWGFTLIELMVVIVIIGVLAALAIPRFTEASLKARIAEAPRVLASYTSAQLAAVAERGNVVGTADLIFEIPTGSKWWTYGGAAVGATATQAEFAGTGSTLGGGIPSAAMLQVRVNNSAHVSHNAHASLQKHVPNFANTTGWVAGQ